MSILLISATLCFILAAQDEAPPQTGPEVSLHRASAPTIEDLTQLETEALIRRLPPAGCEWWWDDLKDKRETDPVAREMARRMDAGAELTDDQWRLVLLSTDAIRFHSKWPKNEDYILSLTMPSWLGIAEIRITPQPEGMLATTVGELYSGSCGTFSMMDDSAARQGRLLGKVPGGTTEITLDVEVERGESWTRAFSNLKEPAPGMLWEGNLTLPVRLVDSFDECAKPVDNELMAEAVRDAIGAGFRHWGEDWREVPFVVIDPDCTKYSILEKTGLDLKVEILESDKVIAESWLIATDFDRLSLANSIHSGGTKFFGSSNLEISDEDYRNSANWVIRLSGRTDHLWLLWHAEQRWSGTISIPWPQAVDHENERTAGKGGRLGLSTPTWR